MRIFLTESRTACTEDTTLFSDHTYPQKVHLFPETYARVKTGLVNPAHLVAEKVLDPNLLKQLRETQTGKTAFILAAGNSNFANEGAKLNRENAWTYNYKILPLSLTQIYAGRVAAQCGEIDHTATDATACTSSLKVLMDVQTLIKFYGFDRVVVLSVEDQVNNMTLQFFGEAKATLTESMAETHQVVPSAFDSTNFGFHIGQGAAFAVFESETAVKRLGLRPKAELLSAWTATEVATNAIGQRQDGQGFERAIEGALKLSLISSEQIKIVKTHGTGTKSNNAAEKTALEKCLGNFVATSYKQRIGHTMGASGLLETLLLFNDLEKGTVPGILNRTERDHVFLSETVEAPDGAVLSLSAGMGNVFSAALFNMRI
jgi:3-oxoacyl-(acyl-carrier-protein) synthase